MATVSVVADNLRVNDADATTNWGNDGGGGGVATEPDILYQGNGSQSRKVGTSLIGREYTHGAGTDMDGIPENRRHYIAKIAATNYGALLTRTSPALAMKVGSSSTAYHYYYLFGNDNYPAKGGFQIVPIAPTVTGYAGEAGDVGSPNDSSILYWSLLGDFNATSKSENLIIDAIDVGAGLHLTAGDGTGSADGVFQDFIDYDEGTTNNRFGYVTTEGPVLLVNGRMAIGQNTGQTGVVTEFTDNDVTVVWQNGLAASGFHSFRADLSASGTAIQLTRCSFNSIGEENNTAGRGYTSSEDTRTEFEIVTGDGAITLTNCNINNFSKIDLSAQGTLDTCVITNSGPVDAGSGADLAGTAILESTVAADSSALIWNVNLDPDGELDDMTFDIGANAHHAIEFGINAPLTMTLRGWTTIGFNGSDANNDSTFYFADRGSDVTWTVNVIGGAGNFTFKKARAGDTVNIVIDPVTSLVKVLDGRDNSDLSGARVILRASDATGDFPFDDTVTITRSGTTASVSHTAHGMKDGDKVQITNANEQDYNGVYVITNVTTNAYDYTVSGSPTSPATGTIKATGVVLEGTTDVNGEISSSRTWTNPQPVIGKIRSASSSPYFKQGRTSGTVSTTAGFSATIPLVIDE